MTNKKLLEKQAKAMKILEHFNHDFRNCLVLNLRRIDIENAKTLEEKQKAENEYVETLCRRAKRVFNENYEITLDSMIKLLNK